MNNPLLRKPSMTDTVAHAEERPIAARILDAFDDLTESERRLAEVVLEAQGNLNAYTAGELASRANVSKATAARFFQRLGYASYNEARQRSRRSEPWGSPLSELAGLGSRHADGGDFAAHVAQDIQNLTRTAAMLTPALLAAAAEILARAPRIWIIGFRNSYMLAGYARGLLLHVRPDVRLLPMPGMTLAEDLASITAGDAVLVIGFRRRPVTLREVMMQAQEMGACNVLITDLTAARTAQLASVTLRCHNRPYGIFDSYAAPISVINYLCTAVSAAVGAGAADRLALIERLHDRLDAASTPAVRPMRKASPEVGREN
jgi:DNA-binding MurR/RpiR family transcriptional regulator